MFAQNIIIKADFLALQIGKTMASRRRKAIEDDLPPVAWSTEKEVQQLAANEPPKKTRRRVGNARKEVSICHPVCESAADSAPPPTEVVGLTRCEMYVTNLVVLRKVLLLTGDI